MDEDGEKKYLDDSVPRIPAILVNRNCAVYGRSSAAVRPHREEIPFDELEPGLSAW